MDVKSFTLRLPSSVYNRIASKKAKSITGFIVEAVEEKLAREQEEEHRRGFATLADFDDPDLALWQSAQRKAMEHVDD